MELVHFMDMHTILLVSLGLFSGFLAPIAAYSGSYLVLGKDGKKIKSQNFLFLILAAVISCVSMGTVVLAPLYLFGLIFLLGAT